MNNGMRRAARTDSTHADIVKALRKVGCRVKDTSRVGDGFPDLIVRHWGCGRPQISLMEVKTSTGKLTAKQLIFFAEWPETVVVRSVKEALLALGMMV